MATIVNDGLSPALYSAILRQQASYERTGHLSTTSCIDSPRVRVLTERHDEEIVVNASTKLPSFIGTCVHSELENHEETWEANGIAMEKEFVIEVAGIKFSGRPDWYSRPTATVGDFKTTGLWTYTMYPKGKWEHIMQANINGYLIRKYGYPCRSAWVELIFLDWKSTKARFDRNYPRRTEIIRIPSLLPDVEVEAFIVKRVNLHLEADKLADDKLPDCTEFDQWKKPESWAVSKTRGGRAVKGGVCKTREEANSKAKRLDGKHVIDHRPGERTRCEHFCEVQQWCNQYLKEKTSV